MHANSIKYNYVLWFKMFEGKNVTEIWFFLSKCMYTHIFRFTLKLLCFSLYSFFLYQVFQMQFMFSHFWNKNIDQI